MAEDPDTRAHPLRRSTRLRGFDYRTNTAYVLTICTHDRQELFGTVVDGEMRLSPLGELAEAEWLKTAELRPTVVLDAHIVMPNHLHGIVLLQGDEPPAPAQVGKFETQSQTVGAIVRGFKAAVTRAAREAGLRTLTVWQRNYHDHIIRNNSELTRFREYIVNNPAKWSLDRYHRCANTSTGVGAC